MRQSRQKKKGGHTAGDKQQAQQENSENGDRSVREKQEKWLSAVDVRSPPDHV